MENLVIRKTTASGQLFVDAYELYERITGDDRMPLQLINAIKVKAIALDTCA